MQGAQLWSLVGELRSHILQGNYRTCTTNERSCIPRRRSRGPQLRTSAANKQISILKEKKKKKGEEYLRHRAEMAVWRCKDEGRGWGDVATSRGAPRATRSWRRQTGSSPWAPGRSVSLLHLDLRLLASRLWGSTLTCCETPSSLRTPIQVLWWGAGPPGSRHGDEGDHVGGLLGAPIGEWRSRSSRKVAGLQCQVALYHGIGVGADPCIHHLGCRLLGRGQDPDETCLPCQGQFPECFSQLGN